MCWRRERGGCRWWWQAGRGWQWLGSGQVLDRVAKRGELRGQVFQIEGEHLALEQAVAAMYLQGHRQPLAQLLQLARLVVSRAAAGADALYSPAFYQCRQQLLGVALEKQEVLAECLQSLAQLQQMLQLHASPLLSDAPQIAPGPRFLPDVDQQQLRCRRVGQ